jgi:hypothetical protein
MSSINRLKRGGLALGVGAVALGAVASPAFAQSAPDIQGSGSSLQRFVQLTAWMPNWVRGAGLGGTFDGTHTTYVPSSSGQGLAVFGNDNGVLKPRGADMDAFVGTDEPPNSTQISNANRASGTTEITIPVTQAPVAVMLSLPVGVTISGDVNFKSADLLRLFTNGFSNWQGLLNAGGATITSGSATAAATPVTIQTRSSESGTTFATIDYLNQLGGRFTRTGEPTVWSSAGVTVSQAACGTVNNGGGDLVNAVKSVPGSVGYANLADASNGGFSDTLSSVSTTSPCTSSAHQIVWAHLEDNTNDVNANGADPVYASPVDADGNANVSTADLGSWTGVPSGTVTASTSWSNTSASNPSVGNDTVADRYPFVAATFVEAWDSYAGLSAQYSNTSGVTTAVKDYVNYITNSGRYLLTGGQSNIGFGTGDARFYAPLPSAVLTKAKTAAALVG